MSIALDEPVARMPLAMRSASLLRRITARCARLSVLLDGALCANASKDSITMRPRHHAKSGVGENAAFLSEKRNRDCPAIPPAGAVMLDAMGSGGVRFLRHAARGEDRARVCHALCCTTRFSGIVVRGEAQRCPEGTIGNKSARAGGAAEIERRPSIAPDMVSTVMQPLAKYLASCRLGRRGERSSDVQSRRIRCHGSGGIVRWSSENKTPLPSANAASFPSVPFSSITSSGGTVRAGAGLGGAGFTGASPETLTPPDAA